MHRVAMAVLLGLMACDGGLEPPNAQPGIRGVIVYSGSSWPSADSLQGLWLFASTEFPVDSSRLIASVLLEPRTIFVYPSLSESLPFFVSSTEFEFDLSPGAYKYIGVIQQLRPDLIASNFRIVGMLPHPSNPSIPRPVVIREGERPSDLRIDVDFGNPPPQPFRWISGPHFF